MSNPNSAPPMASKPSQGAHSTRSTPMTRVGTTRSVANDERTEASDALVQVLSATLIRGTNATPSRAGGTLLPMPGTVEPSHSLAHTAGAPVAILNASGDNNINASETAAPLGLGHALPNTDMSRLASAQSAASHSHSVAIADAPPLIVHHLRQLINEQINRNDAAVQVLPSVGMEEAEEEPLSAAEMERMRSSLSRRPQTLVTTYLSARASMDNGSVETVAPNGPAGGHHIMMDKEVDPSCSARSAHMGPMSTVQLPVLDSKAEVRTFRNPWARARHWMREPLAEALGTFILMVFGNGINAQVNLSRLIDPSSPKGDFLSVSFGWGIGVAMGVYTAGGISGGHVNPAVTISFAVFRGFPWRKVPGYILGQMVGAFMGALLIYGVYSNPLHAVDPAQTELTASIFATYPVDYLRTSSTRISCFLNESVGSAILLLVIMALGDSNNTPPVDGMAPLALLWLVVGIGACLGWQTSYAINPARDLGPRLMLWAVGYTPEVVWTFDAVYWLWAPCLATIVGGVLGCFLYDAMCYTGAESPLNAELRMPSLPKLFSRKKGSDDPVNGAVENKI